MQIDTMNQEQLTLLHEIHAMVREHRVELLHIKEQTTRTNGRVNKHEDRMEGFTTFQTRAMMVWFLSTSVVAFLVNKII